MSQKNGGGLRGVAGGSKEERGCLGLCERRSSKEMEVAMKTVHSLLNSRETGQDGCMYSHSGVDMCSV